ncbi:hypothetical protein OF117_00810 [Geodermatophilus sp. YIM 151500]|uniref:hypothetical protein n=1 Tax=Geodermatophilus sp. YIM 151500 TaxID=2984531 RepID=UPI0021E36D3E|nr:hypothetical protein [Geodermatophilus sp. YIM 151500]MCV2487887.1 hypothetical protein [Geodermatophilus sp. YIM 151500]
MTGRAEDAGTDDVRREDDGTGERPADGAGAAPDPVLRKGADSTELAALLGAGPEFRVTFPGYDRLAVDAYVESAEAELVALRRERTRLLRRFRTCAAELARYRTAYDQGVRSVLAAAEAEAARTVAGARLEAEARLRNVGDLIAAAAAARREAVRDRSAAADALRHAREDAQRLLADAAAERHRLDAAAAEERRRLDVAAAEERTRAALETAERMARLEAEARAASAAAEEAAAARLAALEAEVADLRRQREEAAGCLHRLTGQIAEALRSLDELVPDEPNIVADLGNPVTTQPLPA